jgi:hypothetical protein
MEELKALGLKEFPEYQSIEVSLTWACPHCEDDRWLENPVIGWCWAINPRPYAVIECQACFGKYRHHIIHDYDDPEESFARAVKKWLRRIKPTNAAQVPGE